MKLEWNVLKKKRHANKVHGFVKKGGRLDVAEDLLPVDATTCLPCHPTVETKDVPNHPEIEVGYGIRKD